MSMRPWKCFRSVLNRSRDAGYCLSFVMAMSDESGKRKKSEDQKREFPRTGLTDYKSNAVQTTAMNRINNHCFYD